MMLDKGVFIFSWDFELAWGFHDREDLPEYLYEYNSRAYLSQLLDAHADFEIPGTWGTVGHLLLEECTKDSGRAHNSLPAPSQNWYQRDPYSDLNDAPLWYAADFVEELRSCETEQEIASHTFSHITTGVDTDVLRAELLRCRQMARSKDEMVSFISPRHGSIPSQVLADVGYRCYRQPSEVPPLHQAISFYAGFGAPRTAEPTFDSNGLLCVPESTYFFYEPVEQFQRRFPSIKRGWLRRGLDAAADRREVFHVWAHPHNFFGEESEIRNLRWLFREVSKMRDRGKILPVTMRGLFKLLRSK